MRQMIIIILIFLLAKDNTVNTAKVPCSFRNKNFIQHQFNPSRTPFDFTFDADGEIVTLPSGQWKIYQIFDNFMIFRRLTGNNFFCASFQQLLENENTFIWLDAFIRNINGVNGALTVAQTCSLCARNHSPNLQTYLGIANETVDPQEVADLCDTPKFCTPRSSNAVVCDGERPLLNNDCDLNQKCLHYNDVTLQSQSMIAGSIQPQVAVLNVLSEDEPDMPTATTAMAA